MRTYGKDGVAGEGAAEKIPERSGVGQQVSKNLSDDNPHIQTCLIVDALKQARGR